MAVFYSYNPSLPPLLILLLFNIQQLLHKVRDTSFIHLGKPAVGSYSLEGEGLFHSLLFTNRPGITVCVR